MRSALFISLFVPICTQSNKHTNKQTRENSFDAEFLLTVFRLNTLRKFTFHWWEIFGYDKISVRVRVRWEERAIILHNIIIVIINATIMRMKKKKKKRWLGYLFYIGECVWAYIKCMICQHKYEFVPRHTCEYGLVGLKRLFAEIWSMCASVCVHDHTVQILYAVCRSKVRKKLKPQKYAHFS